MSEANHSHHSDPEAIQERETYVRVANVIVAATGLVVLLLPSLVGYGPELLAATISSIGVGIILLILALIGVTLPLQAVPVGVLNVAVGIWLLLSAALLSLPPTAVWSHIFIGAIVIVVSAFAISESSGVR
ncbi:MAG: hypothetical protein U5L04_10625 [Trueperaceae bacterium]|nr:hypothetical protein [Trueperaceae bacterium]